MQFVRNLVFPLVAPFAPALVFKKAKDDVSAMVGALLMGLIVVSLIRSVFFVPHEKSPDLSRIYDLVFFALAFASRVFLSAGVLWLFLRFLLKKPTGLVLLLTQVALSFVPLSGIIATDTMYLSWSTLLLIALPCELWHGALIGLALRFRVGLSLKQAFAAAGLSLLLVLLMFDDVWGLTRLLP